MPKIIHKNKETALVKTGNESIPVRMQDWLKHLVCIGDTGIIEKDYVTGEYVMTDYIRNIDEISGDVNE